MNLFSLHPFNDSIPSATAPALRIAPAAKINNAMLNIKERNIIKMFKL
jgi:hypothetical protein